MMTPLSGISEQQREHFRQLQQCYATLNASLPYASFSQLSDGEQQSAIDRAAAFMDLPSVGDEEKFQIWTYLVWLKTKGCAIGFQDQINAILDKWETRNRADTQ